VSRTDLYKFEHNQIVDLCELDLNVIGYPILQRFHLYDFGAPVVFNGLTYDPSPIKLEGFELTSKGLPIPKAFTGNVLGTISALIEDCDGLQGAKFSRFRTLSQYLDLTPNPAYIIGRPDIYYIDRVAEETALSVTFELRSVLEINGRRLPGRWITQNTCTAIFKSGECGYTGSNTSCSRDIDGCAANFGANAVLNINAFPGVDLVQS
jgi:lambda family phage minor tail protein L